MFPRGLVGVVALFVQGCAGLLFLERAQPCLTTTECPQGLVCINGGCATPPPGPCSEQNPYGECPVGEICENSECVPDIRLCCDCNASQGCQACVCTSCDANNQCAPGRETGCCPDGDVCVGGYCQPAECGATGTGCCESGMACEGGRCVLISEKPCADFPGTGRCPAGQLCLGNGQCASGVVCGLDPPDSPCGACQQDHVCRSGVCQQLPCDSDHPQGSCPVVGDFCSVAGSCIPQDTCLGDGDCTSGFCSFCAGSPGVCRPAGYCECEGDCPAGNDFCSVVAPRTCVEDGKCAGDADCSGPTSFCCSTDLCIQPNKCCTAQDCAPGYDCDGNGDCVPTGTPCSTNASVPNTGQCAPDQLYCCPTGETCCRAGERCGPAGFCVPLGGCDTSADCLSPLTCQGSPLSCQGAGCTGGCSGGCQGDCQPGELCSADGGCIADTRCAASVDCNDGEFCTGEYDCQIYCGCGCTPYQADIVPPNMLIVLDRSGSMNGNDGRPDIAANTRWSIARTSLGTMMTDNASDILFGLSTYPYYCPGTTVCSTTAGNSGSSANCNNNCDWTVRCDSPCSPLTNADACGRFPATCEWTGAACRWLGGGTATQTACDAFPPCRWNTGAFGGTTRCDPDDASIATGSNVAPGDVDVAVGTNTTAAINASLNPPSGSVGPQHPGGFTPTSRTLRNIGNKLLGFGLADTTRANYVLLVTDGDANNPGGTYGVCDAGGMTAPEEVDCALDALRTASPPVNTFVVGFVEGAPEYLNCHAVHGGTSRCATPAQCSAITDSAVCQSTLGCAWTGSCGGGIDATNCATPAVECFYRANDAAALSAAFASIAGQIASCTYNIVPEPQDWSRVFVYLDYGANPLPPECNGENPCRLEAGGATWTGDSVTDTVQFHEPTCSGLLRAGVASPIVVVGCCRPGIDEGC